MLTQLSDESLMSLYCEGDLLAFKELYRRHSQGLYRFLAWRSPRREWVDEIAQDSWTGLHHARERYRAKAGFRTYLYQIARNRLIDLLRQQQITLASELGQAADGSDVFEQIADHSNEELPPDALLENKQQIAGLYAAVSALPGEQKEALVLQQFSGMSLDEIAQLTGVPAETVKSRLRYAMRKLRQLLVPALAQEEQA
ncbi:sigma-70 family RNA polymerase sigma factor [Undibacterium sp. TJN25]|uniref:sigma-70 family RNA polymerase sigma factor n=1 Tax=Undibacterium sp. TJN25 TaxID=3413056 RepID=UPI003BEFAA7A